MKGITALIAADLEKTSAGRGGIKKNLRDRFYGNVAERGTVPKGGQRRPIGDTFESQNTPKRVKNHLMALE